MLHIIQNDPKVPPGNFVEYLDAAGIMYYVHHPYSGEPLLDMQNVSALIVMGGNMGANDDLRHPFLKDLKALIRRIVSAEIPYLGICLGGQLLAAALGARVVSNRWEELGSLKVTLTEEGHIDELFSALPTEIATFQWHHDSFDIPEGGVLLASSTACRHQAFRFGRAAWGTQFHPEVTEQIISNWCSLSRVTPDRINEMLSDFRAIEIAYREVSQILLANFLTSAGLPKLL